MVDIQWNQTKPNQPKQKQNSSILFKYQIEKKNKTGSKSFFPLTTLIYGDILAWVNPSNFFFKLDMII